MTEKSIYTLNLTDDEFKLLVDKHKNNKGEIRITSGEYMAFISLRSIAESALIAIDCEDCGQKHKDNTISVLRQSLRLTNDVTK